MWEAQPLPDGGAGAPGPRTPDPSSANISPTVRDLASEAFALSADEVAAMDETDRQAYHKLFEETKGTLSRFEQELDNARKGKDIMRARVEKGALEQAELRIPHVHRKACAHMKNSAAGTHNP